MNDPIPYPPTDPGGTNPDLDRLLGTLSADEAARLREVWTLAAQAAPPDVIDADAVARTERVLEALASGSPGPKTGEERLAPVHDGRSWFRQREDRAAQRTMSGSPARRSSWAGRRTWVVGALAGALVLAVLLMRPVRVEAPAGERLAVQLSDGSVVTLNSGSVLERSRLFGSPLASRRAVRLEGEAFFDVAEQAVPFVVETFDADVTVLGTRFGVRAWPSEPEAATHVALVSGRVRVASSVAGGAEPVTLTPGQTARVSPSARPVVADGVEDALAWRRGDLVYKNSTLTSVLADVERRFGVTISPVPADLGRRRVSVALRRPGSAEAVVRDLATALGLRYRARADGFDLFAPSPPDAAR